MKKSLLTTTIMGSLLSASMYSHASIITTAQSTVSASIITNLGEAFPEINETSQMDPDNPGVIKASVENDDESAYALSTSKLLENGVFGTTSDASISQFGLLAISDSQLSLTYQITNETDSIRNYNFSFLIFEGSVGLNCGGFFEESNGQEGNFIASTVCPLGALVSASYEASVSVNRTQLWSSEVNVETNENGEIEVDDSSVGDIVGVKTSTEFSWQTQARPFSLDLGQIAPSESLTLVYSINTNVIIDALFGLPIPLQSSSSSKDDPDGSLITLPGDNDLVVNFEPLFATASFTDPAQIDTNFAIVSSTPANAIPIVNMGVLFALGVVGAVASVKKRTRV